MDWRRTRAGSKAEMQKGNNKAEKGRKIETQGHIIRMLVVVLKGKVLPRRELQCAGG